MNKIIICGSISAADEILDIQKKLEVKGYAVEIPWGVKRYIENNYVHASFEEMSQQKKDNDLIRAYYEKIKAHDIVLVVNPEKKGIAGYIGGNTFLEMGFAYVLNKKLYVLNPLPELGYLSEMEAMQPIILNGKVEGL